MDTKTLTLAEFLLARIGEDERDARAVEKEIGRWNREREWNGADGSQGSITVTAVIGGACDPARVLADCEAKRRIVEDWRECEQAGMQGNEMLGDHALGLQTAMTHLALPYADHPDYRDEWRP